MRYYISTISNGNGNEIKSFEKINDDTYEEFNNEIKHQFYVAEFSSKYDECYVKLGEDWILEEITDADIIQSLEKLWKYLPHCDHIERSMWD